ncbi:MAG: VCBS repeat-containing protein, partial [bacterium]
MRNIFHVGISYQLLHIPRRRFALSLFYFQILCAPAAFSQRSFTSFGAMTDGTLGYRATGLGFIPAGSSPPGIVVLAAEQPSLRVYELNPVGKLIHTQSIKTQHTYRATRFYLANDGTPGFTGLSSDGNTLSVVNINSKEEKDYKLPGTIGQFIMADINRDKQTDVLLFGKNSAGIATLIGQGNGTFKAGPTLFPEVSFSDLSVRDINGDGIPDVLALDWLGNQLSIFYQIGRLIFSEQVSVPLPGEPSQLSVLPIGAEQNFRLAISFPELQQLQVYAGNSLGDYRLTATIACGPHSSGLEFTSLNGDEFPDLVTSSDLGIEVTLGTSPASFSQPAVFGVSTSIASWSIADLDEDGKKDCVILDKTSSRLIALANSDASGKIEWPSEYCVGVGPEGIVIADLD